MLHLSFPLTSKAIFVHTRIAFVFFKVGPIN